MARPSQRTLNWRLWLLLVLLGGGLGWLYRSSDLAKRPMHTDEAILGIKTLELMRDGTFTYDPHDYHGPLLHYSTKWFATLAGWQPGAITEARLRLVTAVYGMGLILIALLLSDVLTRSGSVIATFFIAASPMMNFYSRYYIMETPMVFFCGLFIASLWRWSQGRRTVWLIIAGLSLGAMHAAKETFVLNLAAIVIAYAAVKLMGESFFPKLGGLHPMNPRTRNAKKAWSIVLVVAVITSVALYSNFFHDWQGVSDSVMTYDSYLHRSGGAGHAKPWNYYLTLLFWTKNPLGIWSEALIGGLAFIGALHAFLSHELPPHHRAFLRFLSVYVVAVLAIYSAIPYKTPWTILSADHALALLGGAGGTALLRGLKLPILRIAAAALLVAGIYNLCQQTSLAIDFNRDPVARNSARDLNPYVYSHTTPKIPLLARHIHEVAALSPEGLKMPVQVIQSENGWPLPWYLRDMPDVHYHKDIPDDLDTPEVIIADSDKEEEIMARFAPRAVPIVEPAPDFVGPPAPPPPPVPVTIYEEDEPRSLRTHSNILLSVLVEKHLLDKFVASQRKPR